MDLIGWENVVGGGRGNDAAVMDHDIRSINLIVSLVFFELVNWKRKEKSKEIYWVYASLNFLFSQPDKINNLFGGRSLKSVTYFETLHYDLMISCIPDYCFYSRLFNPFFWVCIHLLSNKNRVPTHISFRARAYIEKRIEKSCDTLLYTVLSLLWCCKSCKKKATVRWPIIDSFIHHLFTNHKIKPWTWYSFFVVSSKLSLLVFLYEIIFMTLSWIGHDLTWSKKRDTHIWVHQRLSYL